MRRDFLGIYTPGNSLFHRLGVGITYLVTLALAVPPLVAQHPLVSLAFLAVTVTCLLSDSASRCCVSPWRWWACS